MLLYELGGHVAAEGRAGNVGGRRDHDEAADQQQDEQDHRQGPPGVGAPLGGRGGFHQTIAAAAPPYLPDSSLNAPRLTPPRAYPLSTRQPRALTSIVTSPAWSVRTVGMPCSARVARVPAVGWP